MEEIKNLGNRALFLGGYSASSSFEIALDSKLGPQESNQIIFILSSIRKKQENTRAQPTMWKQDTCPFVRAAICLDIYAPLFGLLQNFSY